MIIINPNHGRWWVENCFQDEGQIVWMVGVVTATTPSKILQCLNFGSYLLSYEVFILVVKLCFTCFHMFLVSMLLIKSHRIVYINYNALLCHSTISSHKTTLMCHNHSCFSYYSWRIFVNYFDVYMLVSCVVHVLMIILEILKQDHVQYPLCSFLLHRLDLVIFWVFIPRLGRVHYRIYFPTKTTPYAILKSLPLSFVHCVITMNKASSWLLATSPCTHSDPTYSV